MNVAFGATSMPLFYAMHRRLHPGCGADRSLGMVSVSHSHSAVRLLFLRISLFLLIQFKVRMTRLIVAESRPLQQDGIVQSQ